VSQKNAAGTLYGKVAL